MENLEVTFLGKKYFFQSDQPEEFQDLCLKVNWSLDQLYAEYPNYSREQVLLLYILRNFAETSPEEKNEPLKVTEEESRQLKAEEPADEQLGVDLDEIDDILNTDF
jgi:hypothetical protein